MQKKPWGISERKNFTTFVQKPEYFFSSKQKNRKGWWRQEEQQPQ
jgi:hypothetical protein